MASFSSLASMSARPAWPNIWCGGGFLPRRDGGRSFVTMLNCGDGPVRGADNLVPAALWLADHGSWPAATAGSELLHIQRPNGSPISSLRLAAGSGYGLFGGLA